MLVKELKEKLSLSSLTTGGDEREVHGCYCGDLLSWVMSRASEGNCWLTVMGNINAIAVAVLTECSCIVLTENATLDENAKQRAEQEGISVLTTEKNAYQVAAEFAFLNAEQEKI